jgi:4a-hydroxytetrahydrobiopterin dehydratase
MERQPMSSTLYQQHCEPCTLGTRPMSHEDSNRLMASVPRWKKINVDGVEQLRREFHFRDFAQALELTRKIGLLAEREGHHPTLLTEWGKLTVTWWTHKADGLHNNDFVMAAKTDLIASMNQDT